MAFYHGSEDRQLFEKVVAEVKNEEETERFLAKSREKSYTEIEEDVMTFAEAKLNEGIQKGTLKDKRDVVKRQLRKKFGLSEDEAAERQRRRRRKWIHEYYEYIRGGREWYRSRPYALFSRLSDATIGCIPLRN